MKNTPNLLDHTQFQRKTTPNVLQKCRSVKILYFRLCIAQRIRYLEVIPDNVERETRNSVTEKDTLGMEGAQEEVKESKKKFGGYAI